MSNATRDNAKQSASRKRATELGTFVGVRLQKDQLGSLDDWRREQEDLPSRPEAIRRILDARLAAKTKGKK